MCHVDQIGYSDGQVAESARVVSGAARREIRAIWRNLDRLKSNLQKAQEQRLPERSSLPHSYHPT
jgi:hypothetical protein